MSALLDDVRVGTRMFCRNRGYAAIVIATLSVGIAACTLVFSVVNAFLYKPYRAYPDAHRIVFLLEQNRRLGTTGGISSADMTDWRAASRSFDAMAGIRPTSVSFIGGDGDPESVFAGQVTPGYLALLGARPLAGRLLVAGDFGPSASAIVLSHAIWVRRFGSATGVVGKTLSVDGRPAVVVGVLPREFTVKGFLGGDPDIFLPLPTSLAADRTNRALFLVGRLKAGVSTSDARREMKAIAARTVRANGPNGTTTRADIYLANPTEFDFEGDAAFILVLAVGMAFLLLIICANVSNLLFTRASARTREVATRLAIGASRLRVVRLVLTEALMLGLAGSVAAGVIAYWACRVLSWWIAGTNVGFVDFAPDLRVFAFTVAVSLATAVLASLAPAVGLAKAPVIESLKETATGALSLPPGRLRRLLVAFEVGLAIVLLAGAGLVFKGVVNLRHNDAGFQTVNLATASTTLSDVRYEQPAAKLAFADQLIARLQARGEFRATAISSFVPMSGAEVPVEAFTIEGRRAQSENESATPAAGLISASAGYFATLAVPIRAGRVFSATDGPNSLPVAVVNERVVRRWFDAHNPVGTRIQIAGEWRTIVGVVGDVRNFHLNVAPAPTVYVPFAQRPTARIAVLARSATGQANAVAPAIKAEVHGIDAKQPVRGLSSMEAIIESSMGGFDMTTMVVVAVAAVALALAALGIYGSVAFSVARRTREIGIRIALGAAPTQVLRHVLTEGLWLALLGGVPGLLLAAAVGRMLASKLHRVSAVDPAIFGAVTTLVLGIVLVASYVPARRAAKIDPLTATRTE